MQFPNIYLHIRDKYTHKPCDCCLVCSPCSLRTFNSKVNKSKRRHALRFNSQITFYCSELVTCSVLEWGAFFPFEPFGSQMTLYSNNLLLLRDFIKQAVFVELPVFTCVFICFWPSDLKLHDMPCSRLRWKSHTFSLLPSRQWSLFINGEDPAVITLVA